MNFAVGSCPNITCVFSLQLLTLFLKVVLVLSSILLLSGFMYLQRALILVLIL